MLKQACHPLSALSDRQRLIVAAQDVLGGNGYVTNIHFTNNNVEGPNLPIQQLCDAGLTYVKEMGAALLSAIHWHIALVTLECQSLAIKNAVP